MTEQLSQRDQFRRLLVLIAANFVDMVGLMIVVPILPFYALKLEATPEVIGWIIASFSIAQLVSSPFWGRLSDRIGRRPVLLISLLASAVAFMLFGLADTVFLLFLSRIAQGLGGGTTGVAQAYVADTIPPAQRARALGWLSAATSAGVILGPALGSFASRWGQAAPGFFASALCLVNVAFAWRWLPESRDPDDSESKRPPIWHAAWHVLRNPVEAVPRLIWIYAVGMLAFTAMTSVFALYLEAEFRITEKTIGFFFVYVGALSLIMRSLLLGPVVDKIGERWAMRLGVILLAVGLSLYPLMPSLWALIAVIPLVPIGTALLFPSTTSLMSQWSSRKELGTVMGTAQTFAGLSRVAAPLGATILFQRLGHGTPFVAAALLMVLIGLATLGAKDPAPAADPEPSEAA